MGSLSSKLGSKAITPAKNGGRKFPTRSLPHTSVNESVSRPAEESTESRLNELQGRRYQGIDVSLNQRLQQLGPVETPSRLDSTSVFKTTTTHLRSPNLPST
ncbi:hypothetical protein K3495_g16167, partial [Podosphaera aphanis]